MIVIKEVNTGEEIEIDLNNITIANPSEREWNVLKGKNKLETYIIKSIKEQYLNVTGQEMDKYVTSSVFKVTKYYHPKIGMVNV